MREPCVTDHRVENGVESRGPREALFFWFHAPHASERFLASTLSPHSMQPRTHVPLGNSTAINSASQPGWFSTGGCLKSLFSLELLITKTPPSFLVREGDSQAGKSGVAGSKQACKPGFLHPCLQAIAKGKRAARMQNPDLGGGGNPIAPATISPFLALGAFAA